MIIRFCDGCRKRLDGNNVASFKAYFYTDDNTRKVVEEMAKNGLTRGIRAHEVLKVNDLCEECIDKIGEVLMNIAHEENLLYTFTIN